MRQVTFTADVIGNEGQDDEYAYSAGDAPELDERRAERWVRRGKAVYGTTAAPAAEEAVPAEEKEIPKPRRGRARKKAEV